GGELRNPGAVGHERLERLARRARCRSGSGIAAHAGRLLRSILRRRCTCRRSRAGHPCNAPDSTSAPGGCQRAARTPAPQAHECPGARACVTRTVPLEWPHDPAPPERHVTLGATQRRLPRLIAAAIGGALGAWMGPLP